MKSSMIYRSICHKAGFHTRLPDTQINKGRTNFHICDKCHSPCGVALVKDQPRKEPAQKKLAKIMEIVR